MDLEMGNYVKLTAKTRNGRERLQKYGDTWRVTQIDPEPSDCTGWTDWGWFMATPLGNSTQREFWIREVNDVNFEVSGPLTLTDVAAALSK